MWADLWKDDEVRSERLRVGRVKSEENVTDPGAKALSNAILSKHSITVEYVKMDEDWVEDAQHDVAMSEVREERQLAEHSR